MKNRLEELLKEIERETRYTAAMTGRSRLAPEVMRALAKTPRERFVSEHYRERALDNAPLPIGYQQTISQPFVVALMTDLLDLGPGHSVLEIGTGSGYQAAILARLCRQVYSVEYVAELADSARARLQALGCYNVQIRVGNGYEGWPEMAPFDRIIVTAAASHIPTPLLEQLRPGGRMVIPVGPHGRHQELTVVDKDREGALSIEEKLGVVFVPFRGEPD